VTRVLPKQLPRHGKKYEPDKGKTRSRPPPAHRRHGARAFSINPLSSFASGIRLGDTGILHGLLQFRRLSFPDRWVQLSDTFACQPGHICELFMLVPNYIDEEFATPLANVRPRTSMLD